MPFAIFEIVLFMCTFIYMFDRICNINDYKGIEENGKYFKSASALSLMSTLLDSERIM